MEQNEMKRKPGIVSPKGSITNEKDRLAGQTLDDNIYDLNKEAEKLYFIASDFYEKHFADGFPSTGSVSPVDIYRERMRVPYEILLDYIGVLRDKLQKLERHTSGN